MQKKILVTLLMTSLVVGLVGCGSAEEVTEIPTSTETIVEETSIEAEETVVEETTVVETETIEETVEEIEVVEAEPMTFERKDILYPYAVTNFDKYEKTKYAVYCNEQVSSNEYMDLDIMTELHNRGYNIENFVVCWMPALNESGTWTSHDDNTYSLVFNKVNDTDDKYVNIYPVFIKYEGTDFSKPVYNMSNNFDYLTEYKLRDDNSYASWDKIIEAVDLMRADENYEPIDFKIPETYFSVNKQAYIDKCGETDEDYKDLTLNDWYNAMIYAMFELETVDLEGMFDFNSL